MRLLSILFSGLVIAACSGATTTIGGDDDSTLDGSSGTDGSGSSSGSSSGGFNDSGTTKDAAGVGDATLNDGGVGVDSGPTDDGSTAGQVVVTINVTDFFQSCMPPVSDDPVQMKGAIKVQNNMKTAVGPITMTDGAFLDTQKQTLATFKINPATIPLLQPGSNGSADIEKLQGTLVPSKATTGCNTLPCGGKYVVEVTLTAPQLNPYQAMTVPIAIQCAL